MMLGHAIIIFVAIAAALMLGVLVMLVWFAL